MQKAYQKPPVLATEELGLNMKTLAGDGSGLAALVRLDHGRPATESCPSSGRAVGRTAYCAQRPGAYLGRVVE